MKKMCSTTGYYRVNYESKNWMKIALFLQYFNHTAIPVENRAQLIDDAYYFMMKGEVDFVAVCGFIEYLKRETHFVPWYPMFNILSDLYPYMKIRKGEFLKVSGSKSFVRKIYVFRQKMFSFFSSRE